MVVLARSAACVAKQGTAWATIYALQSMWHARKISFKINDLKIQKRSIAL